MDIELEKWIRGNYGRLLAYVFIDGENFNIELVREGISRYYTKYGRSEKYDTEFRATEEAAKMLKLNILSKP